MIRIGTFTTKWKSNERSSQPFMEGKKSRGIQYDKETANNYNQR